MKAHGDPPNASHIFWLKQKLEISKFLGKRAREGKYRGEGKEEGREGRPPNLQCAFLATPMAQPKFLHLGQ